MSEHDEQVRLFNWAASWADEYPELDLLYAIPNGGFRHRATAARLKAEGVRAGVPDVCLPVARGGYHGLYIEMKYGRNKPTKKQRQWLDRLAEEGHKTAVCYGYSDAQVEIVNYLFMKGAPPCRSNS